MSQSSNTQDYCLYQPELVDLSSGFEDEYRHNDSVSVIALDDVSLSEEAHLNHLEPGDYAVLEEPGHLQNGLVAITSDEMFDSSLDYVPEDERNSGGFYFTNGEEAEIPEGRNSYVELKTRFSDELRSYPETIHTHNVPEWYVCVGEFEMKLGNEEMPDNLGQVFNQSMRENEEVQNDWFDSYAFENEVFRVDPGVYHGVMSRQDDAYLTIIRGDPSGEEEWVGKWDLTGEQIYDHFEEEPNLSEINHIEDLER